MEKPERQYEDSTLQRCYEGGWDVVINGANTTNSHFSLFTSPDRTKAWERGKADAEKKHRCR